MKLFRGPRAQWLAVLFAATVLSGCVSGVPVVIQNQSDKALQHVVVSGTGFSESVGTIAAGATETVQIRPRSETAVTIQFDVDGQTYSAQSSEDRTIENDDVYRVDVNVDADLTINIDIGLR